MATIAMPFYRDDGLHHMEASNPSSYVIFARRLTPPTPLSLLTYFQDINPVVPELPGDLLVRLENQLPPFPPVGTS